MFISLPFITIIIVQDVGKNIHMLVFLLQIKRPTLFELLAVGKPKSHPFTKLPFSKHHLQHSLKGCAFL